MKRREVVRRPLAFRLLLPVSVFTKGPDVYTQISMLTLAILGVPAILCLATRTRDVAVAWRANGPRS